VAYIRQGFDRGGEDREGTGGVTEKGQRIGEERQATKIRGHKGTAQ
jgi:hypothetical protein